MKLCHLSINNFRGIKSLEWVIKSPLNCFIGPGDSTKSTIMDAIELALFPNWYIQLDDSDFYNGNAANSINITVTIGDVPDSFLSEDKYGFFLRGWNGKEIHDEPEAGDELVLSINFKFDEVFEPSWTIINDRSGGKSISHRDREKLNVTRLGNYLDRQLSWGKSSPLAKMTDYSENANELIRNANRKLKESINFNDVDELIRAAQQATEAGKRFGVNNDSEYKPSFDTKALTTGLSTVTLHDGNIPLRAKGLGTRRLLALSLQHLNSNEGGIILIDEVEHGLEPYRLRHLLKILRSESPKRQVFITSHSPTTIVELDYNQLIVVRSHSGTTSCLNIPEDMQGTIRSVPETLLARKVLVCEGKTEYGLIRAFEKKKVKEGKDNFAYRGVVIAEGGGDNSPTRALQLIKLGYDVCLFIDSDKLHSIKPSIKELNEAAVRVVHWGDEVSTEERVFKDMPLSSFEKLLYVAVESKGLDSILGTASTKFGVTFKTFEDLLNYKNIGISEDDYKLALGKMAKEKSWYKRIDHGEMLGDVITENLENITSSDLYKTLKAVEGWIYD